MSLSLRSLRLRDIDLRSEKTKSTDVKLGGFNRTSFRVLVLGIRNQDKALLQVLQGFRFRCYKPEEGFTVGP